MLKKPQLLFLISLIFLTACSGLPIRLKSTADQSMRFLNAEMTHAIEDMNHDKPILTDTHQMGEEEWCLTYELGPELSFSSLWEKQEQGWVRLELKPYESNCNWSRY